MTLGWASRCAACAATCAAAAAILAAAPPAAADPQDLVPYCSGDQTPMDSACRVAPSQVFTHPESGRSGVSPDLPYGLNPGEQPAI
ncbi:hypothetical protein [Mycolicibacterium grossiae]|uniref:Intersectin-EH binding protein Ibp1 n=1 Tax=Mycolicibacterium grossiae TaxID=1552759 RepID=A0A1E8QB56_9MYCO|nr:hypothetical protein [Mycolicibacterium grossiae]OFJ55666.1 hypothetical protein BEL07_00155 [Mycolicibacterium grossiae]QEM43504.1 hypothetical protein FZ046_00750 [Mycolicibacterium grossiae]